MLLSRIWKTHVFHRYQLSFPFPRYFSSRKIVNPDHQTKPYRDTCDQFKSSTPRELPSRCDVVIIGGGGMGSSAAYFLKKKAGKSLDVVVIEKDCTYRKASTALSSGCIRQQFTIPQNIMMSRFTAEFLRLFKKDIDPDIDPNLTCNGVLTLTNEEGAENMKKCAGLQKELGVNVELLTADALKRKFPWIRTDGVALAAFGCMNEGWFDPWALMMGLRRKAQSLGTRYVEGEVTDFISKSTGGEYDAIDEVVFRTADSKQHGIKFNQCILAAGAYSGDIARKAGIGTKPGLLSAPLSIEPRKRYVYVIKSQGDNIPPLTAPLVIDTSKAYFRRDGTAGNFICGRSPSKDNEPSTDNLDVDMDFFETNIWPHLAYRIPAFESLKVVGSWAGFYEFNKFDCNGVLGKHPVYDNFYIMAGYSGHGIQKIPAVGRGIAELIVDGGFKTIDLSFLGFDRVIENKPLVELALV